MFVGDICRNEPLHVHISNCVDTLTHSSPASILLLSLSPSPSHSFPSLSFPLSLLSPLPPSPCTLSPLSPPLSLPTSLPLSLPLPPSLSPSPLSHLSLISLSSVCFVFLLVVIVSTYTVVFWECPVQLPQPFLGHAWIHVILEYSDFSLVRVTDYIAWNPEHTCILGYLGLSRDALKH